MYDIDRPKFVLVSLVEEFVRETERSLAYFFAVLVFILCFLLVLFGKDVLYLGIIGVVCLLLIRLRDFIDGFSNGSRNYMKAKIAVKEALYASKEAKNAAQNAERLYIAFNGSAITAIAKSFPDTFKPVANEGDAEKNQECDLLDCLETCRKILETIAVFFPKKKMEPQVRADLKIIINAAKDYLFSVLKAQYGLSDFQIKIVKETCENLQDFDAELLRVQLENFGVGETVSTWCVRVVSILAWLNGQILPPAAEPANG